MLTSAGQASFESAGGGAMFFGSTPNLTPIISYDTPLDPGKTARQVFDPITNHAGQIAFRANDNNFVDGMFFRTAAGSVTRFATSGTPAPGGGLFSTGVAEYFSFPFINSSGKVALVGATTGGRRVFFWDGSTLTKVIGAGDTLDGQTVSSVSLHYSLGVTPSTPDHRVIDDANRVVYLATFTNGKTGVYLYTPPTIAITNFAIVAGAPTIAFTSIAGRTYTVERKNVLGDTTWTPVTGASSISGTGSVVQVTDPDIGAGAAASRFYRVRLLQ